MKRIIAALSIAACLALTADLAFAGHSMIAHIDPVEIPEPASVAILGLGGVFLLVRLRK